MARRGRYEMLPMNINTAVEDYLYSPDFANIKKKFPDVKLEIQLDKSISQIHGSQTHISKIVMNLVINALEAMPNGGTLTVKTEERHIEKLAGGFDNIEPAEYVIMTVSDTGLGIEEKDFKRLFEPFYTKKEMGRSGSGLGLAIVYGVLKDHNGYVDVMSQNNRGSDFLIYLPVLKVTNIATEKIVFDIRGSEKILVVDDLEEQRELASVMLTSLGYKVELAAEGKAAIDYMRDNTADLVILDMIMEDDFDGLDTYREIVKLHPGQKAIIASGFSQTDRIKEAEKLGVGMYIRKPYTMQKLGKAIREVLAGR
jgi:CheY-like chemotaxis protein